jgi:hypothetical protein
MNKIIFLFLFIFPISTLLAHPGIGIVMDSKGNVFYTDLKQVWKLNPDGKQSIAVRDVHSHELYLDAHDNLYGEHLWYEGEASNKWGHFVWKLTADGSLTHVLPPAEGFLQDYSFVRDEHDHMFIADRQDECQYLIQKNRDHTITRLGNACFEDIRWMTATSKGDLYLIDAFDLKKVDTKGRVYTLAKNIQERKLTQGMVNDSHLAMGLWTDPKENVYVAIYGGRKVKKITPDQKVSVVAETSLLWSPTGGLVAPNGDFWLLECSPVNKVRVERVTTDGKRTIYADSE